MFTIFTIFTSCSVFFGVNSTILNWLTDNFDSRFYLQLIHGSYTQWWTDLPTKFVWINEYMNCLSNWSELLNDTLFSVLIFQKSCCWKPLCHKVWWKKSKVSFLYRPCVPSFKFFLYRKCLISNSYAILSPFFACLLVYFLKEFTVSAV